MTPLAFIACASIGALLGTVIGVIAGALLILWLWRNA